jgi:hypothetical protein
MYTPATTKSRFSGNSATSADVVIRMPAAKSARFAQGEPPKSKLTAYAGCAACSSSQKLRFPFSYTLPLRCEPVKLSGAPSGRTRRLPSTSRPPGLHPTLTECEALSVGRTASSRRIVLHGREEAFSTPGGAGEAKARDCSRGRPSRCSQAQTDQKRRFLDRIFLDNSAFPEPSARWIQR